MGDVVNLKLHRKRKERAEKDERAAGNRAKFGRSKKERDLTQAEKRNADRSLDGHKIEE